MEVTFVVHINIFVNGDPLEIHPDKFKNAPKRYMYHAVVGVFIQAVKNSKQPNRLKDYR